MAASVDIDELMRAGHPFLRETAEAMVALVEKNARALGRPARVLEIACASGMLTAMVRARLPDAEIVAQEAIADFAPLAERRLGKSARLVFAPLAAVEGTFDVVYSGGAHHHLPQSYLGEARARTGGVFILGDEFCPEYCTGDDAERIARAELIHREDGWVFTTRNEVAAWRARREVPPHAVAREERRKRALWTWYRFVVDQALAGGHWEVAASELRSASDDFATGSTAEHKMAPSIAERELLLHGFRTRSKMLIGPAERPELHSFFVYELHV